MKLEGIFAPITTPFNANGEIYAAKLEHNIKKWNQTALAGYAVCGSSGESVYLTREEKLRLFELTAEWAAPGKLLIAGTGLESVRETVELTNRAADLGYAVALVLTPHYYKAHADLALYFRAVADQARIPVLIYNMPRATGVDIPAATVVELSAHPNILGIKGSSGNIGKVMELAQAAHAGFQVLTGSAPTLAPSLAVGAVGGVLAYANAAPYSTIAIYEAHRQREFAAAMDWQRRIARAAVLVTTKYGIPGLKYAMDLNGFYGGPPRLPLISVGAEARHEIEAAFADLRG